MTCGRIYSQTAGHRRIQILLQVGCAKYVRALIMKHVNDSTPEDISITWNLDEFLRQKKRRNEKLNEDERNLLYPINRNTDINKWDLTLLIRIGLDYCNPTVTEKMDLKLLKKRRNKLSHSTTCCLVEHKYDAYIEEINIISQRFLKKLNDQTLTDEVNAILNNDEDFSLARLTELMNELKAKIPQNIEGEESSQTQALLSQILDILKQLYPEDNAMSIPDIKLKLDVKNCEKEKEKYICEKVIEYMEAEHGDISDDIKQAVHQSLSKLLQNDVIIVSAENKCVIITLRCHSVRGLSNLWLEYTKDSVDIFEPLQSYLRMIEGYENVQVESEILESDIWECVNTIVGNMFNDQEEGREPDIDECNALESTVSEYSRITKIPYTISHDSNDTFVKIDAQVDSFHHMKHILDVCESGTMKTSLENIATALKENLSLEDLSIEISVDANATLKQIKEKYLSPIVTEEEPTEDIVKGSAVKNLDPVDCISDENKSGHHINRILYQEYQERMHLFGYGSYTTLDSGYETSDVHSIFSLRSIHKQKERYLSTIVTAEEHNEDIRDDYVEQNIDPGEGISDEDTSDRFRILYQRRMQLFGYGSPDANSPVENPTLAASVKDSGYGASDEQSICSLRSIPHKKETDAFTHLLSARLCDVLDMVGASEEQRKMYQECSIAREIILTISDHLQEIQGTSYIIGSKYEGTTTPGMNSDNDILYCSHAPVVENMSDASDGHSLLVIRDEHTQPGFVKLQRVYNGQLQTVYTRDMDRDEEESDIEGRICLKHISLLGKNMSFVERNGPADTSNENKLDLIFAYKSANIPAFASEWIGRKRNNEWPSKDLLNKLSTMGCFFVGVGHPASKERNIEWRLSFALQERELMLSMNDVQHKCYVMLKIIKKDLIEPIVGKSIATYHLKTCMFYAIENTRLWLWERRNLSQCIMLCLSVLLKWVYVGYCPNYFIPEENMFYRELYRCQRKNLLRHICVLFSRGCSFFFLIKLDNVGVFLQIGKRDEQIQSELTDARFKERLSLIHSVISFRNMLYYQVNSHEHDRDVLRMMLTYVSSTKSINDHSEQQILKALTYIIPFIHLHMAQSNASLAFNTNTAEDQYKLLQESGHHLREGRHCDLTSSTILEATVFFKLEQYERCIGTLCHLERLLSQNILSICQCCRRFLYCSHEHVRLSPSPVSQILARTSTCMTFLRSDLSITPEALRYEMFRSIDTPPESRDQYEDVWFDMAVVDAVVYLHFLQYLAHAKLNRLIHKHIAINKLESALNRNANLGHRETGYNLLGWIHFHENCIQKGIKYFQKSWSIRPHHNAAKLHILKWIRDRNYQR